MAALGCGLAIVSLLATATPAPAQTAEVPFSGTFGGACSFGSPTSGSLTQSGTLAAIEGTTGIPGFAFGSTGAVGLNCTSGGSLTTSVPVQVTAPSGFSPSVRQSLARLVGSGIETSASSGVAFNSAWNRPIAALPIPTGTHVVNVGMIAGQDVNGNVPVGNYSYSVTLSMTVN
jgi:hypothetical protein